jgi:hypothetical protein
VENVTNEKIKWFSITKFILNKIKGKKEEKYEHVFSVLVSEVVKYCKFLFNPFVAVAILCFSIFLVFNIDLGEIKSHLIQYGILSFFGLLCLIPFLFLKRNILGIFYFPEFSINCHEFSFSFELIPKLFILFTVISLIFPSYFFHITKLLATTVILSITMFFLILAFRPRFLKTYSLNREILMPPKMPKPKERLVISSYNLLANFFKVYLSRPEEVQFVLRDFLKKSAYKKRFIIPKLLITFQNMEAACKKVPVPLGKWRKREFTSKIWPFFLCTYHNFNYFCKDTANVVELRRFFIKVEKNKNYTYKGLTEEGALLGNILSYIYQSILEVSPRFGPSQNPENVLDSFFEALYTYTEAKCKKVEEKDIYK